MSKNMQLTVTVRPYYKKDFEKAYPRMARSMGHLDPALTERSPSLYELAGQWDQLLYRFDGTPLGQVLLKHKKEINTLYQKIQENIADWKLAEADKLLYSIEDIFDEMESDLD